MSTIGSSYQLHDFAESSPTLLKMVIIGDASVKKPYLSKGFTKEVGSITRTIGIEILHKDIEKNNKKYTLQLWNFTNTHTQFHEISSFWTGADICVLNYAVDNLDTFENVEKWRNLFLQQLNIQEAANFPFIVIGNKTDDPNFKRRVSAEKAEAWSQKRHIPYFEISANDNVNIQAIFDTAITNWELWDATIKVYDKDIELPTGFF